MYFEKIVSDDHAYSTNEAIKMYFRAIVSVIVLVLPLSAMADAGLDGRFTPCASARPAAAGGSAAENTVYESAACMHWRQWKRQDAGNKAGDPASSPVPIDSDSLKMPFTAPGGQGTMLKGYGEPKNPGILYGLLEFFISGAHAAGPVVVDGNLDEWDLTDRLNIPRDRPPYLGTGDLLYGRYVDGVEPMYVLAISSASVPLGPETTVWMNTDQDSSSGYQLWGSYAGAEFFINTYIDNTPHLYNQDFQWVGGPLQHAYSADGTVLEVAVPASMLGISTLPSSIDILADINNLVFLHPEDFWVGGQYTLPGQALVLPPRTDNRKRVGIVFSSSTRDQFFQDKAYSQLFMSLQNQAMMAGVPFDMLTEQDLVSVDNIANYDVLMFPYFMYIADDIREAVAETLFYAVYHYGIGIITADNLLTSSATGAPHPGDSYGTMKQLLGISRADGEGPVEIRVEAADVSHPVMAGYTAGENIINYLFNWYNRYVPVAGQSVTVLADQLVTGSVPGRYPMVLATETGGRNVHFSSPEIMADTNMVWQALQWSVWGDNAPVGIKVTRNNALMLSRNDMDQSQEVEEIGLVLDPLLSLVRRWNDRYGFVGSFYINIGNNPEQGQTTDWSKSAPKYRQLIRLGNEIGTHSWTHPDFTDLLTPAQIEYEFNQSMDTILSWVGPTWDGKYVRGGAVPGAPENRTTAEQILQYLDYLSGGYSGTGAGYPNAFGYMTPDAQKLYFSPNMLFDFTLIQWGIPVGYPPVPVPLTAEEAEIWWQGEMDRITHHASSALIHWPWHDYGPTTSSDPITGDGYTVDMYENTIRYAAQDIGAEFVTLADADERIRSFTGMSLDVSQPDSATVVASVGGAQTGKMAIEVHPGAGQVIQSVDGWYAWNGNKVFMADNGGNFVVHLGVTDDDVSRIVSLPMRSRLLEVTGDGRELRFTVQAQGRMLVRTAGSARDYELKEVEGEVRRVADNLLEIEFKKYDTHRVRLEWKD